MIEPGVYIANAIIEIKNSFATVSVINTNDYPIKLNDIYIEPESLDNYTIFYLNHWSDTLQNRLQNLESQIDTTHMNTEEKSSIIKLCREFNDIFFLPGDTLTMTNAGFHHIPLKTDSQPVNVKSYRLPYSAKMEINSQVEKMFKDGIVENSKSPFNSPLLVVPKKSNDETKRWRVVVDFRRLNDLTINDTFPLPNITEILEQLADAVYFTTLDLADGYHQVPLCEEDKEKTAFNTQMGHYHFTRMPFGLKGAPATFQRIMNTVLSGLNGLKCFVYLDDVVVYGYNLLDHNRKLTEVFQSFRNFNLKLQPKKCHFVRKEICYLGHIITSQGIKPDPSKIEAINKYPTPKNAKEIKSFLGLAGYYRRFIKNFSEMAQPMNALLKKNVQFNWDAFCDESFHKLKEMLINPPILQYPNFKKPFFVTTDASDAALGAILSQRIGKDDLPVAYASRALNKAEKNYSTVEKELLAIVFALKRFRPYLYGVNFTIITDHKPLIWLYKSKHLSSRLMRWRIELDEFDFNIIYKPGKYNINADALSRIELETADQSKFINVVTRSQTKSQTTQPNSTQPLNETITNIRKNSSLNQLPNNNQEIPNPDNAITTLENENDIINVIKEFHNCPLGGHQGIERTFKRIKCYYYFPRMLTLIKKFIQKCELCQKNKVSRINKLPMVITTTSKTPFEKIFLDIVGPLNISYNNNRYILTIQDDLSKFSLAIPLENQLSETIAKAFVDNFICRFGAPLCILTDQGSNFISELIHNVCKILKIKKLQSTAYHPQTNGALERSHRTIVEYIRNFIEKDPNEWDHWLPFAMFTYNTTPHSSTNLMPFEIIHGFKPNIPTSLKTNNRIFYNPEDYLQNLRIKLGNTYELARNNLITNKEKSKTYYDKSSKNVEFNVGDKVLLKNEKRKGKFDSIWNGPFEVINVPSNVNTSIRIGKQIKIVHNNRLKLFIE